MIAVVAACITLVIILTRHDRTDDGNMFLEHGDERPRGSIGSRGIAYPVEFLGGKGHIGEFKKRPEEDAEEDGDHRTDQAKWQHDGGGGGDVGVGASRGACC